MKQLKRASVWLGTDPEFFFTKNGRVVASEIIIPKDGIDYDNFSKFVDNKDLLCPVDDLGWHIVRDGVQGEINVAPNICRETLANKLASAMSVLVALGKKHGVKVNFTDVMKEVSQKHFDEISDDCKKFGCAVSYNIYEKDPVSKVDVDPMVYRKRSAGGHVHLGYSNNCDNLGIREKELKRTFMKVKRLVPMLDILVGNTLVLLDRHDGNKERRENYGRAGEYRTPIHGIEYRTPSNFWLKDYKLYSFVMALSRMAVDVVHSSGVTSRFPKGMEAEIRKAVDIMDIRKAINTNDYDLAYENFLKVEPILMEYCTIEYKDYTGGTFLKDSYPLHKGNIEAFHFFLSKGVDHWFKKDPVQTWFDKRSGKNTLGWENFLKIVVKKELAEVGKVR